VSFQHFSVGCTAFQKALVCGSHGNIADELDNTGLNQGLAPFWIGLKVKFTVIRGYTFDGNTLPSSEGSE
jgi:hypothetical protein